LPGPTRSGSFELKKINKNKKLNFKIQKKKKKKVENWQRLEEEKKNPFIFLCMPFISFAIFKKKKNQISNFKI
jgi:hypothetical protein